MKRVVLLICLWCLGAFTSMAEVRTFTMLDGKTVTGEIKSYNQQTDKVVVNTDAGKPAQFTASQLSDADFVYVRDWDAVQKFSENTHFRVYLDGPTSKNKWTKYLWRRPPGKVEPYVTFKIDHNRISFTIKVDNQTGYDLENVELKYCIYYEQERMDSFVEEKVTDLVVRPSVKKYAIFPAGTQKKFESNSVVLRSKEFQAVGNLDYLEGDGRFIKNKMIGMIFRATLTTQSGLTAVREMRVPKTLSEEYAWVEPTPENIIWPDDDLDEREDTVKPKTMFEEMGGKDDEGD